MAKTADVQQAIWCDPWFTALDPDAKLLYLWAITTDHGNLAGLFVVAQPLILAETGMTAKRLNAALADLDGKIHYRPESGALWVVGRAKHVRSKTSQIAKSIIRSVSDCPEPELQAAFVAKYGGSAWLGEGLQELALPSPLREPQPNLNRTSHEVPSHSHSHSPSPTEREGPRARVAGKPVTDDEQALAEQILDAFNAAAGTAYTVEAHRTGIVGRIREHPDLDADAHRRIIAANFAKPWWKDRPRPNVLYGNAAAFEGAVEKARGSKAPTSIPRSSAPRFESDAKAAAEERWGLACEVLAAQISQSSFESWIEGIEPLGVRSGVLHVAAAPHQAEWLARRYGSTIESAIGCKLEVAA